MNEIIKYINSNNIIENKIKKFDNLSNENKKKTFIFINKKNLEKLYYKFLLDININRDKYNLNFIEIVYFYRKINEFISNSKNITNYYIDPFNITRVIPLNLINNTFNNPIISKNYYKKNFDFSYLKNCKIIQKLGIYILPKNASPAFKNFKMTINYLKKYYNLYLFIDNDESELDILDKQIMSNTNVFFVKNQTDKELMDLVYNQKLSLLISIYGFYKRAMAFKPKPAPIMISYLEPSVIYPNYFYDFNLLDENIYEILKPNLDEEKYKIATLKNTFIFPIPYYSNFNSITKPLYNKNEIRIGIILHGAKLCHKTVILIKEIVSISPKIKLTIYGYFDDKWLNILFDTDQIVHDKYDNKNPTKLLSNILYIDTIMCNNHSTALELLKLKRPIIGFNYNKRYHGIFSQSIIKNINMEKYLLADNIRRYKELVKIYVSDENTYNQLYNLFIKNLEKSNILSYEHYTMQLVKCLNDIFENFNL